MHKRWLVLVYVVFPTKIMLSKLFVLKMIQQHIFDGYSLKHQSSTDNRMTHIQIIYACFL